MTDSPPRAQPLAGLRVLDLSRVLAGPWASQILGDLGADVVKVERPGSGDDTRAWGPPYLQGADGQATRESAYFLCANRNKRSIAIDMASPQGQQQLQQLAAKADIVLENFKTGGLAQYGGVGGHDIHHRQANRHRAGVRQPGHQRASLACGAGDHNPATGQRLGRCGAHWSSAAMMSPAP